MTESMLGKGVAIVLSPRDNVAVALKDLKSGDFNDIVRVVATARVDPAAREFLLSLIKEYLSDYIGTLQQTWHVTEKDVEDFVRTKRLKGLAEKLLKTRFVTYAGRW